MARLVLALALTLIAGSYSNGQTPRLVAPAQRMDVLRVEEGPTITSIVARSLGLYQKYGIDVQSSTSTTSEAMRSRLASGTVDILDDGLDNAVSMTLSGSDIVIVSGSRLAEQELIAQPGIQSVEDLRGKIIIVDAIHTQAALLLKKILLNAGLRPEIDYRLKEVGTRRLPELKAHKEYAAGMLSGPTAIFAKRQGFVSLGTSSKLLGPLLYSGSYVRRDWAREHSDLLSRYIAAQIDAQRWLYSDANKDKAIEILRDSAQPRLPADVATETYEAMIHGAGTLTRDLRFDVPAFRNFLKLRAEVEGSWGGVPPPAEKFYDLSYYKAALRMKLHSK